MPSLENEPIRALDDTLTMYTYDDMKHDMQVLCYKYPDLVAADVLTSTVDGRDMDHLVIGDPKAEHAILIHAGIHGREYITCKLAMRQAADFLQGLTEGATYQGSSYEELLEGYAIHLVPMVNPDGVSISQFGWDAVQTEHTRQVIEESAGNDGSVLDDYYLEQWKANANGVNLNRNFDALWERFEGLPGVSSWLYKGTSPASEPESKALVDLTEEHLFDYSVSYHAMGQVIYWNFGQTGSFFDESLAYAQRLSAVTGYRVDGDYGSLDPGGYKDWEICALGLPGVTIEVGYGDVPVEPGQFPTIWEENRYVWQEILAMRPAGSYPLEQVTLDY